MSLVNTRPGLKKYFTKKGTLRKKLGKPKTDLGIRFTIYAQVKRVAKSRKLTMWKAWLQLTKHKQFPAMMKPHFQKQKKYKNKTTWRKLITNPDWKKNFYKNNLKKPQLVKRFSEINFEYKL